MANYFMDLEQTGTGHAGDVFDPWSYADHIANAASIPANSVTFVKGTLQTALSDSPVNPAVPTIWELWDYRFYWQSTNDPWRLYLTATSEIDFSNTVLKNGIIYKDGPGTGSSTLKVGATEAPDPYGPHVNMLIQATTADSIGLTGSVEFRGCSFKTADSIVNDDSKTVQDCTFDCGDIVLNATLNSSHCSFTVPSLAGTHTDAQWSWPAGVAWPAYDAHKRDFAVKVLGATLAEPAVPGTPPYEAYPYDMWGDTRTNIGGFNFFYDVGFIIKNQNYYPPYWTEVANAWRGDPKWLMIFDIIYFNGAMFTLNGSNSFWGPENTGMVSKSIDNGYNWTTEFGNDVFGGYFCLNTDTNLLYISVEGGPKEGIWTSTDGSSWTQITTNNEIERVFHYSPLDGYFYTLRYGAPTWDGIALRSPDAINWVEMNMATPLYIYDYAEFNGELYACGRDSGDGYVHKLTGTTWNPVYTIDYPTGVECLCMKVFKGHLYVGVSVYEGYIPSYYTTGEVHRTADGIVWEKVGTFDSYAYRNMAWLQNEITNLEVFQDKLYAVSRELYETENGTDWTNLHQNVGNQDVMRSSNNGDYVFFTAFTYPYV